MIVKVYAYLSVGGMQYWEQPQPTPTKNDKVWRPPHRQSKAVNIELAAYATLVKTEKTGVVSALPIVRWLSGQRNANGGFSSTQVRSCLPIFTRR